MAKQMPNRMIDEEAAQEEESPPESEETDLNQREGKRWEPSSKYSKYIASYYRQQLRDDSETISKANLTNVESSRADILPKVERVIEKFNGSFKAGEKVDGYNTSFEPDINHIDQKLVVDDETGHIIGL